MRSARSGVLDNRDALGDGDSLTVTTETRGDTFARLLLMVWLPGLLALIIAANRFDSKPPGPEDITAYIVLSIMTAAFAVIMLGMPWPRGTWTIDAAGITFRPCRGSTRRLAWSDVERVLWQPPRVILKGRGVTIHCVMARLLARPALERIEKMLAPDFDLGKFRYEDPDRRLGPRLAWLAGLFAIGLALVATWTAIAFALAVRFPGGSETWIGTTWLYVPLIVLAAHAGHAQRPGLLARKQAHPAWPWRLRRAKPEPIDTRELT